MSPSIDTPAPDGTELARQLRQCRQMSQSQAVDLDRAKSEIGAARARAAAFAGQLDEALLRVATLEEALARLQAERDRLAAQPPAREAMSQDIEASLRAEIETLLRHRDEAQVLRQSTSWRVTRPLRALRRPKHVLRILLGRKP